MTYIHRRSNENFSFHNNGFDGRTRRSMRALAEDSAKLRQNWSQFESRWEELQASVSELEATCRACERSWARINLSGLRRKHLFLARIMGDAENGLNAA